MYEYNHNDWLVILVCVALVLILVLIGMGLGIFASPDVAVRTLEAQGYSDIQITDRAWFLVGFRGCDRNDAAQFTAKAINPAGKPTEVIVCTGVIFKGGTVRVR